MIKFDVSTVGLNFDLLSIHKALAVEGERLVLKCFRTSTDPYGQPWAELKCREGKPLLDTGLMRNSTAATVTSQGASVVIGAEYAVFHQNGTRRMVARKMVPDHGRPSESWNKSFEKIAARAMRNTIKVKV